MLRYKSLRIFKCGRVALNCYNGISYKNSSIFFSVKNLKLYPSYKKFTGIIEKKTTSGIVYKTKYLND